MSEVYFGKKRRIRATRASGHAEIWDAVNVANHRIKQMEEALIKVRNVLNQRQLSSITPLERQQMTREINAVLTENWTQGSEIIHE